MFKEERNQTTFTWEDLGDIETGRPDLGLMVPVFFNNFIAQLQQTLKEQKIGILRVEEVDLDKMTMVLTVAEDLDCSGLPPTDEVVCQYDEGFIAGILEAYTGKKFRAKEIDCWANGDRVCRFKVGIIPEGQEK